MSLPLRQPARHETQSRKASAGFTQVPNSIIENLSLLTPAETDLLLSVLKLGRLALSDDTWQSWTGAGARMKELAIKGLIAKGLEIVSRDRSTVKLRFNRSTFESWALGRPRHEKARTHGRRATATAKPGQRIHPECREKGCQKLCSEEQEKCEVIQIDTGSIAKPVSRFDEADPPDSSSTDSPSSTTTAVQKYRASVAQPDAAPYSEQFTNFLGIFIHAGVETGPTDHEKCHRLWQKLSPEEQGLAVAYAEQNLPEWQKVAPRYIPRPWTVLRDRHWERKRVQRKSGFDEWAENYAKGKRSWDLD